MRLFYQVMLALIAVISMLCAIWPDTALGGAICFTLAIGFQGVINEVSQDRTRPNDRGTREHGDR